MGNEPAVFRGEPKSSRETEGPKLDWRVQRALEAVERGKWAMARESLGHPIPPSGGSCEAKRSGAMGSKG